MYSSCTASVGITDGACRTSETAKLCWSAVMQANSRPTVASIHTFYLYLLGLQGEL